MWLGRNMSGQRAVPVFSSPRLEPMENITWPLRISCSLALVIFYLVDYCQHMWVKFRYCGHSSRYMEGLGFPQPQWAPASRQTKTSRWLGCAPPSAESTRWNTPWRAIFSGSSPHIGFLCSERLTTVHRDRSYRDTGVSGTFKYF